MPTLPISKQFQLLALGSLLFASTVSALTSPSIFLDVLLLPTERNPASVWVTVSRNDSFGQIDRTTGRSQESHVTDGSQAGIAEQNRQAETDEHFEQAGDAKKDVVDGIKHKLGIEVHKDSTESASWISAVIEVPIILARMIQAMMRSLFTSFAQGATSSLYGLLREASTESDKEEKLPDGSATHQNKTAKWAIRWERDASVTRLDRDSAVKPDPIGITVGSIIVLYCVYAIFRRRREANRIISLFEANTQIKELAEKASRGEQLPSIVVIRGHIASDGGDIGAVSRGIEGLRDRVGVIEQPKNAWIEIARQAKRDPQLRGIADAVVERTGVDADDVPDVPEPMDPYARQSVSRGEGPLVLSEVLVARICAKHQRRIEDKKTKKVTIKRPCRNESYNCFHGRRVSEGLHLIDLDGTRADLELPAADAVGLAGISEPPPLFLPVSDVWTEFTHYLRKDGLTGPGGRRQRLDDLPPMRLSDPYTLLSEFIFIDVQSPGDLGGFEGNNQVLNSVAEAYRTSQGPAKFLWEPRGFYDSVRGGGYDDVPAYINAKFRRTEMVSAYELVERAQVAARENSRSTPYCEPTFSRAELEQRRDLENCFRYTELAIPRGCPVTILARPMIAEAGTGEGAECRVRLVSPLSSEEAAREGTDSKADRFRFRILKGHRVENLLRHRDLNVTIYYVLTFLGLSLIGWAATGYQGIRS
jgi:hypothetical protein